MVVVKYFVIKLFVHSKERTQPENEKMLRVYGLDVEQLAVMLTCVHTVQGIANGEFKSQGTTSGVLTSMHCEQQAQSQLELS